MARKINNVRAKPARRAGKAWLVKEEGTTERHPRVLAGDPPSLAGAKRKRGKG